MIIGDVSQSTEVDEIRGLSPTIAIHQKTVSNNPRSTVGTITEIYDYYRLLFTHIGVPHCPNHPHISLVKNTLQEITHEILREDEGVKMYILFPLDHDRENPEPLTAISKHISDAGFVRFLVNDTLYSVADDHQDHTVSPEDRVFVVVDRLVRREDDAFVSRLKDGLRLASERGGGKISVSFPDDHRRKDYSLHASCARCGYTLPVLSLSNFSFNSHHGACEDCC